MNAIIAAVPGLFFTAFFFYAAAFYFFKQVSFSLFCHSTYFSVIQLYIRVLPVLLVALCNEHQSCFVTNSVWSLYSQFPLCENPNTFVTDSQILAKNIIIYFIGKSIIIGQVEKCYLPRRFSQRCAWLLALVINQLTINTPMIKEILDAAIPDRNLMNSELIKGAINFFRLILEFCPKETN